jgi:hypothetical protein
LQGWVFGSEGEPSPYKWYTGIPITAAAVAQQMKANNFLRMFCVCLSSSTPSFSGNNRSRSHENETFLSWLDILLLIAYLCCWSNIRSGSFDNRIKCWAVALLLLLLLLCCCSAAALLLLCCCSAAAVDDDAKVNNFVGKLSIGMKTRLIIIEI